MAMNPCRCPRPSSCDRLISMHGWGPSYSLIGPVSSWHRLRLTPAEDPAGCVPPSHHAYACCIPHDWMRPPGPGEHAPVEWMSVPECLPDSRAKMLSFHVFGTNVWSQKTIICPIRISNSVTKKGFPGHIAQKWQDVMSSFSVSVAFLEVTPFWAGDLHRYQMKTSV